MGERGNIVVKQGHNNADVYLYTHWKGDVIQEIVAEALAKKQRWDDSPYLTRIIFDVLASDEVGSETGFGITTYECDNNYPLVIVDPTTQTVTVEGIISYLPFQDFVDRYHKKAEQES